jgi:hypothetical protein
LFSLISGNLPVMTHVTALTSHPICGDEWAEFRSDAHPGTPGIAKPA